ncbi:MAG: FtsH protease activity modulator HflK [Erysipelotrichaceae bacterium]|nr:FtsH protease activity modulator HflK [Erysipelotrichaceae bacterium]
MRGGIPKPDLKFSWKKILPVLLIVLVALAGNSSFYSVSEDEQAVVTMFGKVQRVDSAGLHFKIPFAERVTKVDMTTHGFGLGYQVEGGGQNIDIESDARMITSDFNLINIDFYLEYKVSDPIAYLFNTNDPEMILANEALSCIRATVTDYPVDEVMTTGKGQIQSEIRETLSKELNEKQIGLQIVNVSVQDSEPPTAEVARAFKAVETARQGKETAINDANRYRNEQIPYAEAEADRIIQEAEAEKTARIAEAEGQAERFEKMYEEYSKFPLITKKRMFYEAMEDTLPDLKVIISDGSTQTLLPLETFGN